MPKVEVDIPVGYELACDSMRRPVRGELFLTLDGLVSQCTGTAINYLTYCIILRKKWEWPKWLKAKYIFYEEGWKCWVASNAIPLMGSYGWEMSKIGHSKLSTSFLDFVEPERPQDWRDSLMENPNAS